MEKLRAPGDEIRGVGPYHTRVEVSCEKDLDRLHQEEGHVPPWMGGEDWQMDERLVPVLDFLYSLRIIGDRKRRIFFGKLENLTFAEMGLSFFSGDKSPQSVENDFSEIMRDHPNLARAFPERGLCGAMRKTPERNNG